MGVFIAADGVLSMTAVSFSVGAPTTNPFLTNSKKIPRSKHATNTQKHGRGSYLSDGTRGDSQSHVEREPLPSKDRGIFTYNIESICLEMLVLYDLIRCDL